MRGDDASRAEKRHWPRHAFASPADQRRAISCLSPVTPRHSTPCYAVGLRERHASQERFQLLMIAVRARPGAFRRSTPISRFSRRRMNSRLVLRRAVADAPTQEFVSRRFDSSPAFRAKQAVAAVAELRIDDALASWQANRARLRLPVSGDGSRFRWSLYRPIADGVAALAEPPLIAVNMPKRRRDRACFAAMRPSSRAPSRLRMPYASTRTAQVSRRATWVGHGLPE